MDYELASLRADGFPPPADPGRSRRHMDHIEANGAAIPALGFGTWQLRGDAAERMVGRALEVGYRHIDTAQSYGNEDRVGRAIERSGVPRSDLFLATKVWVDRYGRRELPASVRESLRKLRTDRVDLLMLHWPNPDVPLAETFEALNEVREAGLARHVGVSNFTADLLARAAELSDGPLAANQVEYHPFLDQTALLEATRRAGVALIAYSPLAKGRVPGNGTLTEIGRPHAKSAAQVALRWLLQQEGVAAIPRTSRPEHCEANFAVFDFELSEEEMDAIHGLAGPEGRVIDPAGLAPDWD